jgi:hypothetical protein
MGGYGYAREYDVEQLYRDNRLNQIHEGTNGIQALDLLGRKVMQDGGACFATLVDELGRLADGATSAALAPLASELAAAVQRLGSVTSSLAKGIVADATRGLSNASVYLDLTSRVVYAALWLRQAVVAEAALAAGASGDERAFYEGKLQAARYYFGFELPKHEAEAALLLRNDASAFEMRTEWF